MQTCYRYSLALFSSTSGIYKVALKDFKDSFLGVWITNEW